MSNRAAVLLSLALVVLSCGLASAGDEEGCLFCHRLDLRRAQRGGDWVDLRVWEPPGGIHAGLYCSDCHPDARTAPHPVPPGPSACIGECHGSVPETVEIHRRASFGAATESHRAIASPHAPCLLCHRSTDRIGDTARIVERCVECHPAENGSVAVGVHARFYRSGGGELCVGCHRTHPPEEESSRAGCAGEGCHAKVTGRMMSLAAHDGQGEGERKESRLPEAGAFLSIAAIGWLFGRMMSPSGRKDL